LNYTSFIYKNQANLIIYCFFVILYLRIFFGCAKSAFILYCKINYQAATPLSLGLWDVPFTLARPSQGQLAQLAPHLLDA